MLSIKSEFSEADIYLVKTLASGHPVYKIEGWADDHGKIDTLVVKKEDGANSARTHVQSNVMIMNVVDRRARTEMLSPREIDALKAWCGPRGIGGFQYPQVAMDIMRYMGSLGSWTKMEFKNLTMLDSAAASAQDGDKADVRTISRALKKSGGLEKFGEILAVDLFVGSSDRFYYPSSFEWNTLRKGGKIGLSNPPRFPDKFIVMHNMGNVFVASGANGKGRPIGLEIFDPNNYYRDFDKSIDDNAVAWTGSAFLKSNADDLKVWAGYVITDLETALGPRNRKSSHFSSKRLGSNRKARLVKGIYHGEKIMKRNIEGVRKRGNVQMLQGLEDRGAILGWW